MESLIYVRCPKTETSARPKLASGTFRHSMTLIRLFLCDRISPRLGTEGTCTELLRLPMLIVRGAGRLWRPWFVLGLRVTPDPHVNCRGCALSGLGKYWSAMVSFEKALALNKQGSRCHQQILVAMQAHAL